MSVNLMGGGDFIGDEAFLLAAPVILVGILVGVGSFAWVLISTVVSGSVFMCDGLTSGLFWDLCFSCLLESTSSRLSRYISGGVELETVLLSPESKSITGVFAFSSLGSICFGI